VPATYDDPDTYVREQLAGIQKQFAHQCRFLRDIFANPFRPRQSTVASWQAPTVVALARSIYDDRRFTDLPILADALEEAGCTNADILGHLRGPGQHVRGCWAVDLILQKP
jgi:hypothetical protein